jgi:hypothetical protein
MVNPTRRVNTFIGALMLAATVSSVDASFASHDLHLSYVLPALLLAVLASRMKVKLPGINGTMSVNLPFLLAAIVSLSAAEAIVIACVSTTAQCWPGKNAKFNPQQMAFNLSMMAFATCMASRICHMSWLGRTAWNSTAAGLALAAASLFLGHTGPVAAIISLSEGKAAGPLWRNLAQLSFPYYVLSAGLCSMIQTGVIQTGVVGTGSSHAWWLLALTAFPVMYGVYRSYRMYFGKREETARTQVLARAAGAGA